MTVNIYAKKGDEIEKCDSCDEIFAEQMVKDYQEEYGRKWIVWAGKKNAPPEK